MFTHLDAQQNPTMVDVGAKSPTRRTAHAVAVVALPPSLSALIEGNEIVSPKGPIFHTATLAGIMGAKRTSDLIPLCHPLPLDNCTIQIESDPAASLVTIHCHASTTAKTGVEMEALTGASVAALTLYDMGKAVAPGIEIRSVKLLSKTGGKADYHAPGADMFQKP